MMNIVNNTNCGKQVEVILRKVLLKTSNKRELGLVGTLTIDEFDYDRMYITNEQGEEFTIRTWNFMRYNKGHRVDCTLFKTVESEYGGMCGKELVDTTVKVPFDECE